MSLCHIFSAAPTLSSRPQWRDLVLQPKVTTTFGEAKHIMFDEVEPIIFALSEYIMLRSNISFFCEAKDIPSLLLQNE